jgi:hypothetical protein
VRAHAIILAAALAGCSGGEERINPVNGTPDAGMTDAGNGGTGGTGGAPADAGPPKRTVLQRNPFGNVKETQNLLWDGDFELYSPFSDEYGWLSGASASTIDYVLPDVKMGAACRSGMRCASLKKHHIIAGLGVAATGAKLEVSFWAHVAKGVCSKVNAFLSDWESQADPDVMIMPASDTPDAGGWCSFDAVVDARKAKPLLFIQNNTDGELLVDDCVLKKAPPATALKVVHGPISAGAQADLEAARARFQRLRGPHDTPPNAARRAYETWRDR